MMLRWKVALIISLFVCGITLVWVSLWQQEIVIIDTLVGRTFNFMGFGDQGLEWWSWRDIFYLWIIITIPMFVAAGYYLGTLRERKRKRSKEASEQK